MIVVHRGTVDGRRYHLFVISMATGTNYWESSAACPSDVKLPVKWGVQDHPLTIGKSIGVRGGPLDGGWDIVGCRR